MLKIETKRDGIVAYKRGGIFKVKNSNSNEGYGTWEGLRVFGIFNPERGGGRREGGGLGT